MELPGTKFPVRKPLWGGFPAQASRCPHQLENVMSGAQAVGGALWKDLRGAGARDQASGVPGEACLHCGHVSISLQTLILVSFLSTCGYFRV